MSGCVDAELVGNRFIFSPFVGKLFKHGKVTHTRLGDLSLKNYRLVVAVLRIQQLKNKYRQLVTEFGYPTGYGYHVACTRLIGLPEFNVHLISINITVNCFIPEKRRGL